MIFSSRLDSCRSKEEWDLQESKRLEKIIDNEIKRVEEVTKNESKQLTLF